MEAEKEYWRDMIIRLDWNEDQIDGILIAGVGRQQPRNSCGDDALYRF